MTAEHAAIDLVELNADMHARILASIRSSRIPFPYAHQLA